MKKNLILTGWYYPEYLEPFKIWMAKVAAERLNAADTGALDVDDGPAHLPENKI